MSRLDLIALRETIRDAIATIDNLLLMLPETVDQQYIDESKQTRHELFELFCKLDDSNAN